MCTGVAASSSDDEAPHICNIFLHTRVWATLQPLLHDDDLERIALSCRFACDALCAELYTWPGWPGDWELGAPGDSVPRRGRCPSDSDEQEPAASAA